jgi:hypothetical protein
MKYLVCLFLAAVMATNANAHEMVPTYPKLEPSFIEGLSKTTMTVFNKRPEVEYYEIGVFNKNFESIPFVSSYKIYKIPYLSTVTIEVYIRDVDKKDVTYICSRSKLKKADLNRTAVSSKICSKVKQPGE